jgi:hypothetical protein
MMRTVEAFIVIVIILGAFGLTSYYTVLPNPQQVSPMNLRRLALTTLETLDSAHDLSIAAFDSNTSVSWSKLQVALAASLPANIIYNLTVYNVNSQAMGTQLYSSVGLSASNAASLGASSDASTYSVASSNVTFSNTPKRIGENSVGGTLYILDCNDANGWWITGYTPNSLAAELNATLSKYFLRTVMVQSTADLGRILTNNALQGETVQNAVVINTCGEAVPIPTAYTGVPYSNNSYAYYSYFLGQKVNLYNWTWVSIVGYPFYYVSNTNFFTGSGDENGYGLYGMKSVGSAGLNSFLRGLDGQNYVPDTVGWIALGGNGNPGSEQVTISSPIQHSVSDYYGVYPYITQTATRAVSLGDIQDKYNLNATASVFDPVVDGGKTWLAGSTFEHCSSPNHSGNVTGKLIPIGLTRSTDIKISELSILSYYKPSLISSQYSVSGNTSRIVVLQLGLAGGS